MSLTFDTILVSERLYDAVYLRAAESAASTVAVLVRASLDSMLADFMYQRLKLTKYYYLYP